MLSVTNPFDSYSLNARLKPALLTLFPILVTTALLFPEIHRGFGPAIVSLAGTCGVLALIARLARYRGRELEKRLYKKWGGMPTTAWLRHRDTNLDPITKARYHKFLAAHLRPIKMPTPSEEAANADAADEIYRSATKWLIEHTRSKGKFPLVFQENINYGFHRNTYAMKPIAISIALISLIIPFFQVYFSGVSNFYNLEPSVVVSALISATAIILWGVAVSESWVHDAACTYTRALFASCEKL